jgi:DNA-binding transcriptional LysR family regulator
MNIKYRQLKAFSLAAQLGSFAKAAAVLCITQPSFSTQIRELESDLGMSLFERTTRSCRLTIAGQTFLHEMLPILQDMEMAYGRARETGAGRQGQLLLSALPSLSFGLLTGVLSTFHQQHPHIRIMMREELNMPLIETVKRGDVEIGIGSDLTGDPEVGFTPLFFDRLMVVAPRQHVIFKKPMQWSSVEGHPLIMLAMGSAERALQHNRPNISPAFEVAYMSTAVNMVRHGMGITILPSSALKGVNMDGLRAALIPGRDCQRTVGILFRKRATLSTSANTFIKLLSSAVPTDTGIKKFTRQRRNAV